MIENTYSDMGHPLYEWIKSGNAWSPAWESGPLGIFKHEIKKKKI